MPKLFLALTIVSAFALIGCGTSRPPVSVGFTFDGRMDSAHTQHFGLSDVSYYYEYYPPCDGNIPKNSQEMAMGKLLVSYLDSASNVLTWRTVRDPMAEDYSYSTGIHAEHKVVYKKGDPTTFELAEPYDPHIRFVRIEHIGLYGHLTPIALLAVPPR